MCAPPEEAGCCCARVVQRGGESAAAEMMLPRVLAPFDRNRGENDFFFPTVSSLG